MMNSKIYGKLAVTNLKNNRKNYLPYILASAFSVMMYFIMDSLYRNPSLVKTGATLSIMLSYANVVLLIFSVIFLFYINSFLIKRRKKELGIYNILGMGKGHLAKMLFIESIITTTVSIIGGILAGILFGKLVYLVLLKILHLKRDIVYMISPVSVGITAAIFGCIFFVIFLYNLVQMKLSNPIELLRGGNAGEREPKTKWLMTIIGSVCLAGGYYISLTTKEPLQAIGQFFVAVLLVVAGTYALFMAGSITLLKLLRKKKSYYYKTRHFTAISGMIYRMKQNRERYHIMQKVGMSKKEVRQSIRSQVLLVFFLPLIMAVIHLAFAFKIITRLLSVLNLTNISLFFMYTVGTVAVFAVIYVIIYSITAREYYKIIICRGE